MRFYEFLLMTCNYFKNQNIKKQEGQRALDRSPEKYVKRSHNYNLKTRKSLIWTSFVHVAKDFLCVKGTIYIIIIMKTNDPWVGANFDPRDIWTIFVAGQYSTIHTKYQIPRYDRFGKDFLVFTFINNCSQGNGQLWS